MPHKIYGQYISYMFLMPTVQVWNKLYTEGKLKPPQTYFWETKPPEELYDLETDPDETKNLVDSPQHQQILARLRQAERDWVMRIRDLGFLPENEIHSRSAGSTPSDTGHNDQLYPMQKIMDAAELASSLKPGVTPQLVKLMSDTDSAVRYWGAMGLLMRGKKAVAQARQPLLKALSDEAPSVRIAAAEALGRYSSSADARKALNVLMQYANPEKNGVYLAMMSLNAIDYMDARARPAMKTLAGLPTSDPKADRRLRSYCGNLIKKILADLEKK